MYRKDVDPRALADLLFAILVGLRLGRLLWRDDFDLEGAMQSLFLMHAGLLINGTDLGLAPEVTPSGRGRGSG
jgi:hypothetical protein